MLPSLVTPTRSTKVSILMAGIFILAGMMKLAGLGVGVMVGTGRVASGVAAVAARVVTGAAVAGSGVTVGWAATTGVLVGAGVGSVGPVGKGVTATGTWVNWAPFSKVWVS